MTKAMLAYRGLIEAAGAEIVDHGTGKKFAPEQPEMYESARRTFGNVDLVYLEFWHDGGCIAKGITNQAIVQALKRAGWEGMITPKKGADGDIYLYIEGETTRLPIGIHRAGSECNGFNLVAPVVFLPADDAVESYSKARAFLGHILEDLTTARATVAPAIAPLRDAQ